MTELEQIAFDAISKVSTEGIGFSEFMQAIANIATTNGVYRELVALSAPVLAQQEGLGTPLDRWARLMDRGAHGDEDGMILAVALRTQLEYAIVIYRGSLAEEVFRAQCDEDFDNLLAERACELAILPTAGIPRSHRWWCWAKSDFGLLTHD